ncbi:MAG: hypothetical protein ACE5EE_11575, partial [Fidelibacterota bacterium]
MSEQKLDAETVVRRAISYEEQLDRWVEGESIHKSDTDECCPDFSCCRPELLTDKKTRELFRDSKEDVRLGLLGGFLGEALAGKKAYIAGLA